MKDVAPPGMMTWRVDGNNDLVFLDTAVSPVRRGRHRTNQPHHERVVTSSTSSASPGDMFVCSAAHHHHVKLHIDVARGARDREQRNNEPSLVIRKTDPKGETTADDSQLKPEARSPREDVDDLGADKMRSNVLNVSYDKYLLYQYFQSC